MTPLLLYLATAALLSIVSPLIVAVVWVWAVTFKRVKA